MYFKYSDRFAPVGEHPDIFGDDCGLPLIPSRKALHYLKECYKTSLKNRDHFDWEKEEIPKQRILGETVEAGYSEAPWAVSIIVGQDAGYCPGVILNVW